MWQQCPDRGQEQQWQQRQSQPTAAAPRNPRVAQQGASAALQRQHLRAKAPEESALRKDVAKRASQQQEEQDRAAESAAHAPRSLALGTQMTISGSVAGSVEQLEDYLSQHAQQVPQTVGFVYTQSQPRDIPEHDLGLSARGAMLLLQTSRFATQHKPPPV